MPKYLGIDIGSHTTVVYAEKKGIILREPTLVALSSGTGELLCTGSLARITSAKRPGAVILKKPVREGRIENFEWACAFLEDLIEKTRESRPSVLLSCHRELSEEDKRAFADAVLSSGACEVALIDNSLAAVVGGDCDISDKRAMLVCDMGAGVCELSVVSGCVTRFSKLIKYGGDRLDSEIAAYIKREFNAIVSEDTARSIRENIGSLVPETDGRSTNFSALDFITGLPLTLALTAEQTGNAMLEIANYISACAEGIIGALDEQTRGELTARGAFICGGTAQTSGFDTLISAATGLNTTLSELPCDTVAEGLGIMIENRRLFEPMFEFIK